MADNRAFHSAILASLALHALALFVFPDLADPARRSMRFPPPIIARLMEPEPAAPSKAAPEPRPAAPVKRSLAPKLPTPAPEAQKSAPRPALEPQPSELPAPLPTAPPEMAAAPLAVEPAPATEPLASAKPGAALVAPRAEGNEARTADQYRLELIAAANRIKDQMRYPPQARENNWEGDVLLGLAIRANGRAAVAVKRGSQYEVLDRQAAEILRQAIRVVELPPALRGKETTLQDVAIEYRLLGN